MSHHLNRRRQPRFLLSPMYHAVSVRRLSDGETFADTGHAYDVSAGGIQFELDNAYEPGTEVAVQIHLPEGFDIGPGRAVFAIGRVIWLGDLEDPGPVRMAVAFRMFPRAGDQERLMNYVSAGRMRVAA